jgi:hypothetical protein
MTTATAERDAYSMFLERKRFRIEDAGKAVSRDDLHPRLFGHQADICSWALKKGRAACFADTGLGKGPIGLQFAQHAADRSIIFAPLAVANQFVREAEKFGMAATYARCEEDAPRSGITTANYEMMHRFDPHKWGAVAYDESGIIKNFAGKTRNQCIEFARPIKYRLPASATPSPNDYVELGNHAELLGIMSMAEMLATFFVHDGALKCSSSAWRLKKHAEEEFFKWLGTWSVTIRRPSDLGYDDGAYNLPPMTVHDIIVETPDIESATLFQSEALTLTDQRKAKRSSLDARVAAIAERANSDSEPWLIWAELNDEADALTKAIPGAVQVAGSDTPEQKESRMLGFTDGTYRVLVSKASICGHGMNWQHCSSIAHVGVTNSWEAWKQANARCWRFGQTKPVNVYRAFSEAEQPIVRNLERKGRDADRMMDAMIRQMQSGHELMASVRETIAYQPQVPMRLPSFLKGAA